MQIGDRVNMSAHWPLYFDSIQSKFLVHVHLVYMERCWSQTRQTLHTSNKKNSSRATLQLCDCIRPAKMPFSSRKTTYVLLFWFYVVLQKSCYVFLFFSVRVIFSILADFCFQAQVLQSAVAGRPNLKFRALLDYNRASRGLRSGTSSVDILSSVLSAGMRSQEGTVCSHCCARVYTFLHCLLGWCVKSVVHDTYSVENINTCDFRDSNWCNSTKSKPRSCAKLQFTQSNFSKDIKHLSFFSHDKCCDVKLSWYVYSGLYNDMDVKEPTALANS